MRPGVISLAAGAVLLGALALLLSSPEVARAHGAGWGTTKSVAAADVRVRFVAQKVYCRPPVRSEISRWLPSTDTWVEPNGARYWNHFICRFEYRYAGQLRHGLGVYHATGECDACWRFAIAPRGMYYYYSG